jgi:hypothetical protein
MTDAPLSAGDLLGSDGVPNAVTHDGRSHPLAPPDMLGVLERVEATIAQQAVAELGRQAAFMPKEWTAKREKDLMRRLGLREHRTGGAMWAEEFEADGGTRGVLLVLYACLVEGRDLAKDKAALPPPIAFDDLPGVLLQSPDAKTVAALLVPDFFGKVAGVRNLPPEAVAAMVAEFQRVAAAALPPAG